MCAFARVRVRMSACGLGFVCMRACARVRACATVRACRTRVRGPAHAKGEYKQTRNASTSTASCKHFYSFFSRYINSCGSREGGSGTPGQRAAAAAALPRRPPRRPPPAPPPATPRLMRAGAVRAYTQKRAHPPFQPAPPPLPRLVHTKALRAHARSCDKPQGRGKAIDGGGDGGGGDRACLESQSVAAWSPRRLFSAIIH